MASWHPESGQASALWKSPKDLLAKSWDAVRRLEEDRGLHQIVDVSDHLSHGHNLATLVKRSLISSSYVVLKTPAMHYKQMGGDEMLIGLQSGWHTVHREVEDAIIRDGLHENDYCIVLPERSSTMTEAMGGDNLDAGLSIAGNLNDQIAELESHIYSIPVGADYATVRRLLLQDDGQEPTKAGLLMPDIRNLSVDDLTNLRKDHDDAFARLRYALKHYLDGLSDADDESRFAGVIEEVDYECRTAKQEFLRIKRKHSRSVGGMIVTASLVAVAAVGSLFAPELLTASSAALGSVSLADVIKTRVTAGDNIDQMEKNDFWIAWRIHQENIQKS